MRGRGVWTLFVPFGTLQEKSFVNRGQYRNRCYLLYRIVWKKSGWGLA